MREGLTRLLGSGCLLGSVLIALVTPGLASQDSLPSSPRDCRYSNSKCDPSSATFTCRSQPCVTVSLGPFNTSSYRINGDFNMTMKTCVRSPGNTCITSSSVCATMNTYLIPNCAGPFVTSDRYQSSCG